VVIRNFANRLGGGIFRGTLNSCLIVSNTAYYSGGGAYGSILQNCNINGNSAGYPNPMLGGGGAFASTLQNCIVCSNTASDGGGILYGVANNSTIFKNRAVNEGGGAYATALNNCVLKYNTAPYGGGAANSGMINCSVVYNTGTIPPPGGSGHAGGVGGCTLTNCIVYYNVNDASSGSDSNYSGGTFAYSCTAPLPGSGAGNISNEPVFIVNSYLLGDFHLQSNSPCINSGNNSAISATTDLDGNPRIVGGTVDIGAYEYQTPTSIISYAWLQQYGLPTDGSADYADSDGDGMNNYAEWKAGTNPTDATSVLKLLPPANSVSGITVTWQSVSGVTYYLRSSTNLPAFTSIQSNIVGQAGSTSYTDITATNGGPYYYRVGVQ